MVFSLEDAMPETEETDIHCDARMAHLTRREQEVMAYLLRGAANKVIAAELGISQRTVESHRARLFRKMRVRNIVGLVSMMYAPGGLRHCVAEASADAYRKKRSRST
ncbi:response regulator transcription factor [Paracandidimonas soli]